MVDPRPAGSRITTVNIVIKLPFYYKSKGHELRLLALRHFNGTVVVIAMKLMWLKKISETYGSATGSPQEILHAIIFSWKSVAAGLAR
jgi:hypothetical protein